jgi:hypothetical protein
MPLGVGPQRAVGRGNILLHEVPTSLLQQEKGRGLLSRGSHGGMLQ